MFSEDGGNLFGGDLTRTLGEGFGETIDAGHEVLFVSNLEVSLVVDWAFGCS